MYELFYGLNEKPFTLLPDPEFLYLSPKHQRALTLLQYGMLNHAGFCVICGDTGAGKTTLIRCLLEDLGDDTCVGLITNTHQSFGELLNWVLMAFGLGGEDKTKAQMHHLFIDFLIEQYAQNKHVVLIVDEAQNMSADTLEELRMLSNINADKDQILQIILAGQPALRDTLRKPELMQFVQRIAVDYYLESLNQEETVAYIRHRLKVAGSEKNIFTDEACRCIYQYSGGTPRLINLLCDTALVYGYAEQNEEVKEQLVHDVVREQHSNSIISTFNTNAPNINPFAHDEDIVATGKQTSIVNSEKADPYAMKKNNPDKTDLDEQSEDLLEEDSSPDNLQQNTERYNTQDEVIAELAQRAVKAVSLADQTTKIRQNQTAPTNGQNTSSVKAVLSENINRSSQHEEKIESSNVTSIKTKLSETLINKAEDNKIADDKKNEENKEQKTEEVTNQSQVALSDKKMNNAETYPMVHIEERKNMSKGLGMLITGMVVGMFVASILMVGIVWYQMDFEGNRLFATTQDAVQGKVKLQSNNQRELEFLKKERDAAIAVSRALERERDAALSAAKIQEQIRVTERRAAQTLAEQKNRAEKRIRDAQQRAREAERAEAKAVERERALKLKAEEEKLAELEAKRQRFLKEEMRRKEIMVQEELEEKRLAQLKANEEKQLTIKKEKSKAFSANPCNSPSAKFLSTCKK